MSKEQKETIQVREVNGEIVVMGLIEEKTDSFEEMMQALHRGSLKRRTSSTLMNKLSSRSHAIFTI